MVELTTVAATTRAGCHLDFSACRRYGSHQTSRRNGQRTIGLLRASRLVCRSRDVPLLSARLFVAGPRPCSPVFLSQASGLCRPWCFL